ncbi:MAG: T9SS type A sorting domain-containing protein, partial [Bacteroidia bacterium]
NIYCYLLTATGIQAPVINSIGHPDNYGGQDFKFSASGKKLAMAVTLDGSEIFDFNATTGILSNPILFPACNNCGDAGVEFSPDETKLYFTRFFGTNTTQLCQVNVAAGTPTGIVNSITVIDSAYFLVEIQRGKDGKIYVANATMPALGVINNPNALGTACQFDTNGVFLNGKKSTEGLPNFVSSYFYDSTLLAGIKQLPNSNKQVKIYPNPSTGIIHIECADAGCTSTNDAAEIIISNMLGQNIKQFNIENTDVGIEVFDLPNGIYIIEINTPQYKNKQKLIIYK